MSEFKLVVDGDDKIIAAAAKRTFKTGSEGYQFADKCLIDGERYQVNVIATRIGSKPAA